VYCYTLYQHDSTHFTNGPHPLSNKASQRRCNAMSLSILYNLFTMYLEQKNSTYCFFKILQLGRGWRQEVVDSRSKHISGHMLLGSMDTWPWVIRLFSELFGERVRELCSQSMSCPQICQIKYQRLLKIIHYFFTDATCKKKSEKVRESQRKSEKVRESKDCWHWSILCKKVEETGTLLKMKDC
jgi:hypothetical protein